MMAIVGFLPPDDPRLLATIEVTEERLTDDRGLVYRYRTEGGVDGLAGEEGTFLLCTFWLAQALALSGQVDRAEAVFGRAAGFVNDVGLLAEEVDPASGELLGNFPQAFSHYRSHQRRVGHQRGPSAGSAVTGDQLLPVGSSPRLQSEPRPSERWSRGCSLNHR